MSNLALQRNKKSLEITIPVIMSLNNIVLPARLVADLYASSLIEHGCALNPHKPLRYLGKNEKNILILVSKKNVAFLEDDELKFLFTILAACKLGVADVAIVNLNAIKNPNYSRFINELKAETVLLFDVSAQTIDLPFNFPHFQLQQFSQSVYLSAPAIKDIESDKELKMRLWSCLKKLFPL